MKRILSVLLSLLCLLLCIPFTTGAVESEPEILFWEQAVSRYPAGYSEDYNGNVFITTGEGLAWLISAVNGLNNNTPNTFEGKTVTLGNSIDLSAYYWTPVGNAANPFKGTFNGAGFQITGLRFNFDDTGYSDVGFFGYLLQGKICNVLVETSQFYFRSRNDQPLRVGGLCGSLENSTLVNVSFCGTITGALTTEKDLYVGGLCGVSLNSKVYNSYTVSNVTAIGISRVFSGGLSGFLNGGELLNCFSSGNVTASTKDVSNVFVEACVARVYNQGVVKGCYWKKGSIIKSNQSEKKNKRGVDESVGIKGQSIGSYDTEWILTATDGTQLQYGDSLIAALNVFTDSNEEFAPWSDHGKLPVLIYIEASASTITTQPGDISVTLHQINGQLEVKIQEESGYLYQYQWYLDGVAIKGATASVFNIPSDLTYETNGKHTGFCRITSYMINSGKTADIFTEVSHIQLVCVHHFQGEPTILKEAGPGVEGAVAYVCTICKETEIEVIPAQPRNIRLWIYLFAGICILVCSAFLYMKTAKNK